MPKPENNRIENFYYSSTNLDNSQSSLRHFHSSYEIYYLQKGICRYLIEGKLFTVKEGDTVFIPKGKIHKTSYEGVHSRLLINCSGEYLKNADTAKEFVYRNEKHKTEICNILKQIEKEYFYTDKFSPGIIIGLMQQLCGIIYRNENTYENSKQQNRYVEKALEILNREFASDISLSMLSERFNISPEHFSRVFKKETGLGFNEYLSLLRLKKAESIIKADEKISVSETAFSCGFNDSNYFCEKFKKIYGLSPLKYRNKYKK